MEKKIVKNENGVFIAESVYENTSDSYKGIWTVERWDFKNWEKIRENYIGKRTWMPPFSLFGTTCQTFSFTFISLQSGKRWKNGHGRTIFTIQKKIKLANYF